MSRLAAALAVLALAAPGTASAFSKQDRLIAMSDGVKLATTYYVPDGVTARGRLAGRDALPRPRREQDRPGNPARDVPELARRVAARAAGLCRAHLRRPRPRAVGGARLDRRAARDPGRARALRLARRAAGRQRAADRRVRLLVRRRRDLARDGRRRPVRRDRAGDHVDRPLLRAPAAGPRPLGRPPRVLAVDPGTRGSRPGVDRERRDRRSESQRRSTRSPTSDRFASSSARSGCRRSSCRAGATSPSISTTR